MKEWVKHLFFWSFVFSLLYGANYQINTYAIRNVQTIPKYQFILADIKSSKEELEKLGKCRTYDCVMYRNYPESVYEKIDSFREKISDLEEKLFPFRERILKYERASVQIIDTSNFVSFPACDYLGNKNRDFK